MKNIFLSLICILIVQAFCVADALAAAATPDSANLFDNHILTGMARFMHKTYQTLGNVLMIGHALMCYAIKVDYTCVFVCALAKIPNLGFLIVGAIIYVVGVLMSLSIGMYFLDIAFKLGFAILFMPVSIALWPFPPTKNKFSETLNIIIRNGMLFMLVAVGVSFAISLISNGLMEGGQDAFWDAIADKKTETLSENFSLFSTHILVVGFSLIFGFKILESSVSNYLNSFFSDPAFGRSSPMHFMATQAVGLVSQNAVKPALSFAKDVASHQTGKAIAGVGNKVSQLSTAQGRHELAAGIKGSVQGMKRNLGSAANKMLHPRQTYNQAMQYAGKKANQVIQWGGTVAKTGHDYFTAFMPTPFEEADRQLQVNWVNKKIDNFTAKWGNRTENLIAHGGEGVKQGIATGIAKANNGIQTMRGKPENKINAAEVRAGLHTVRAAVEDTTEAVVQGGIQQVQQAGAAVAAGAGILKDNIKQTGANIAQKGAALAQKAMDNKVGRALNSAGGLIKEAYQTSDQAPISAAPTKIISTADKVLSAPFKAVRHPIKTVRKLAQLPDMMEKADNAVDKTLKDMGKRSFKENTRVILKSGGQIVFRTAKDTMKDAQHLGENTAGTLGNILTGFGNSLADNSKSSKKSEKSGKNMNFFANLAAKDKMDMDDPLVREREEQEYFAEMDVDH